MTRNPNDKVSLIGKETQNDQPIAYSNFFLSDNVNKLSLFKLFNFVTEKLEPSEANVILNGKLTVLRDEIYGRKKKNVEIHRLAAEMSRQMGAVRVVNCKSGKDRTGMAITLEQARILRLYGYETLV